ncbi:alpha/beta fold hydrolase [Azohydromonas caseinilytica]|uniref:Alpha/beta hydrolase n=1 Tax=Azohydromonas caseinilytica TaxID=2728836 RepID=A0A848F7N0_9BURK|nr:alpha/beta hydrolase [Azohydromonas caseinilytica]NML14353.1 alpha/beta hydrolase [Azohydromonas caseinilytica]
MNDSPRLIHVPCLRPGALYRMACWEWGDPANERVLVCVHGLTRQGRDFDTLARALCHDYRVVCPDVLGRGHSDWLHDPAGYTVPAYVADMVSLLSRLEAREIDWVGTSMGGLIGMGLGSLANAPLRRMVLNDVGPDLEFEGLQRISDYVGQPRHWDTEEEAAAFLHAMSESFGPHTDEQWLALCRNQLKPDEAGFTLHYDLRIAQVFKAITPESVAAGNAALWHAYEALRCPVLLLRGAQSDLLSHATAQAMTQRGPRARLVEFEGVGHAPMLVQPEQVAAVREFLLSP